MASYIWYVESLNKLKFSGFGYNWVYLRIMLTQSFTSIKLNIFYSISTAPSFPLSQGVHSFIKKSANFFKVATENMGLPNTFEFQINSK